MHVVVDVEVSDQQPVVGVAYRIESSQIQSDRIHRHVAGPVRNDRQIFVPFKVTEWPKKKKRKIWFLIPKCFSNLPNSVCTIEDRGIDEIVLDETIDCQVIELLRDEVLPNSHEIPHQFILNVVVILNKGSIHSATTSTIGCDSDLKLREEFAKTCFETLLQFSLLDDSSNNNNNTNTAEGGVAGRLAVTALLHRFQEVLKKFNDDERQSGKCPLPRY